MASDPFTIGEYTAGDGYRLRYRHYAASTPRMRMVLLHGIQSHGGWYEHSCTELAKAGCDVIFLERRGSGLNEQARGDTPGFRRLLDDVAEFLRERQLPRPIVLGGISWGGKLAVAFQRRHPGLVDALMLLCPGLFAKVRPPFSTRLRILAARIIRPKQLFPIPLSDPELFTATPRWLEFLRNDPLRLHSATARFLVESVRLDGYVRFARHRVRVPVLLLLAGRDRIIDNVRTRKFVERMPAVDRQIIEYPEAHHTLEFEPDPGRFVADMKQWLEHLCR